jgi:hypothetical protein
MFRNVMRYEINIQKSIAFLSQTVTVTGATVEGKTSFTTA